jgi:SH3 domain protein
VNIRTITLSFLLIAFSGLTEAKTVYATDTLSFDVKAEGDSNSKTLTTINSGTAVTLISKKAGSGYAKIRLANGETGYILNTYLNTQPANKFYLDQANQEIAKLKEENNKIAQELAVLKKRGATVITENLTRERDKLANELTQLRSISGDAVEVRQQRDKLQENVVNLTKQLEQVKLEKNTLETNSTQEWFFYGGILALFGVLLGYILPKLSMRSRSHHWDTL